WGGCWCSSCRQQAAAEGVDLERDMQAFQQRSTWRFHTEMRAAFEQVLGRDLTVGKLPWRLMRLAGPIVGQWRELSELAYLWHIPHRLDGTKLEMALGPLPQTPLAGAVASALADLGVAPPPPMPDLLGRFADA
ncbi:MAG: hypothetical protein ACK40O_13875, partial [Allosphingosinicella sp.]